jgi:hypothetical protein
MDEVDFTILAATSVLGDLIEKCPPAEACRDAFDRMSKATVQMCMSTTGFGSSTQGLNSRRKSRSQHHSQNSEAEGDYFNKHRGQSRPTHGLPRPKPQFDMSLNDLLGSQQDTPTMQTQPPPFRPSSQNSTSASSAIKAEFEQYSTSATPSTAPPLARQNSTQIGAQSQSQSQSQSGQQTSTMQSPSDYAISPPLSSLDTSAIDPSLLPSAENNWAANVQSTYSQNPYQELQFPFHNAPGMDFLTGSGWDGSASSGVGENGGYIGDLGMGLGWEGVDHDFSEGGNGGVDLFDGFFFGGTGNF